MTKSHEHGENEISLQAKLAALKEGKSEELVLKEWLDAAKRVRDGVRVAKIIKAQKYLRLRNRRKRGSK